MEIIATNQYYEIRFDAKKNRAYLRGTGFWTTEIAQQYIADTIKYLRLVKPGFTIVSDVRELLTQKQEVQAIIEQSQKLGMASGLFKAASVVPKDFITEFQLDTMSQNTNAPKGKFASVIDAEIWLDNELVIK